MKSKITKKIIAVICSAALMLSAASTMMFTSVSAETYDYYSIFSADTDELPSVYAQGSHCKYEIVDDTVRNDGGKIVKVTKNGMYNNEPNIAFKQDFSELAKDSVGIRVFLAKSEDATAGNLVSFAFGSTELGKVYGDTGTWGTANHGNCTTEGSWYEFYWDNTTGLSTANISSSSLGDRVMPVTQSLSTDNKIDADFISGMDSIYIHYHLASTTGHYAPNYYFFDDVQFIYPEGKAPAAATSDPVTTQEAASIRLNDPKGIRFYTKVDETALKSLVGENDYEIGTLIAPTTNIGEGEELTADLIESKKCVDVKFQSFNEDGSIDYYDADNKLIAGSLVNIQDKNIKTEFVARAYVKVGDTYTYSSTTSTRSVQGVASAFKDKYENEKDSLTTEEISLYENNVDRITAWANGEAYTQQ